MPVAYGVGALQQVKIWSGWLPCHYTAEILMKYDVKPHKQTKKLVDGVNDTKLPILTSN